MMDSLFALDRMLFSFCNQTLANPVSDAVMPVVTDLNQTWYGLTLFGILWFLLAWKGGRKGQVVAMLLIPLIAMSDQLSSSLLKALVARPRPCHEIGGVQVVAHIHMLVPCGGGYSFPSSHAVNNFAVATFLSYYYRRWTWAAFSFAALVAFSRLAVGVHYPSDILGGAAVGFACAAAVISIWRIVERRYSNLIITPGFSPGAATEG